MRLQREAVHRRSGILPHAAFVTIPGLQRVIPLRCMPRCAREASKDKADAPRPASFEGRFAATSG
jgi:hypothetical protein